MKNIFFKISTKPASDSMKWAGKERSILASILLWGLWICRVLSLLQILKLAFRKIALLVKQATTDKNAKRVNVPPMFCEIYYLLWFGVFVAAHLLNIRSGILNGFIIYYLFESVVWVLYYTVFRRFFEENYSIYHELEYLTVLILIIPTQALGFATLYNQSFRNMICGLLGAGQDSTPFPVRILGALFGAIVISMIISAFPSERVKKNYNKSKAIVIGGGDVVSKRVYPALVNAANPFGKVEVLDLESYPERHSYARYFESEKALSAYLTDKIDNSSVVWVETPTRTHAGYLSLLLKSHARLIAIEKPIAHSREDIDFVKRTLTDEENRKRIFFLSYYMLEKALPLRMLFAYDERYKKYLDIDDEYLAKNWRMAIGSLVSAEVVIHEGKDERKWISEDGGHLYETFLHNLLIATLIVGRPANWENTRCTQTREGAVESISLSASVMGAPIKLSQKKGVAESECCRYARFEFSDGLIEADFERQSASVRLDKLGKTVSISMKDAYKMKYSVMADLVMRCYEGELSSDEVDGLENQIECLEWLSDL